MTCPAATLHRFVKQRGLLARQLLAGERMGPRKEVWRIDSISDEDRKLLTEWRRAKDKTLWQKAVTVLENRNLLTRGDCARKWRGHCPVSRSG